MCVQGNCTQLNLLGLPFAFAIIVPQVLIVAMWLQQRFQDLGGGE